MDKSRELYSREGDNSSWFEGKTVPWEHTMPLLYCTTDQYRVSSYMFVGVMPLLELRIPKLHSFSHFFPTCFDILMLKFCTWLYYTVLQINFECRQFVSIFLGVMPLLVLIKLEIHSFPHFSPTCFDMLSWYFAYAFVILYYRSISSVVNLRQCLKELSPFRNLEYWKYTASCTFLLHALTFWAEILHINFLYCTTDQFRVSSICVSFFLGVMPLLVKFSRSYAPFGT